MLVGWNKIKVSILSPPLLSLPPFNQHHNSLIATIREVRSDVVNDSMMLLMDDGQPIPKEMPPHFLDKHIPHIEGIGEPTTATFFTHSNINPTNWFVIPSSPPLLSALCGSLLITPPSLFGDEKVDVGEIWWSESILESSKQMFLQSNRIEEESSSGYHWFHAQHLPWWWIMVYILAIPFVHSHWVTIAGLDETTLRNH